MAFLPESLPTFDKHREYQWYFRQKVNKEELRNGYRGATNLTRLLTADTMGYGFSLIPSVVENDPTPDMTIDISGAAKARDRNGDRIQWDSTQDFDVGALVTLPAIGNEKWVTVLVGYAKVGSDPRVDGNGDTLDYQIDDSFAFTLIEGTEVASPAQDTDKPSLPPDDRILVCDILLTNAMTQILNADIDTSRMLKMFPHGTLENDFELGLHNTALPSANSTMSYMFNRGSKPNAGIRVLEGADPNTDEPFVQFTDFSDSDTFVWKTMLRNIIAGSNVSVLDNGDGTYTISASTAAAGWDDSGTYLNPIDPNDSVIIGSVSAPHASAKFQVDSTDKGFIFPRMTTAQRDLIATPATGLLIYNTDTDSFDFYNGSSWISLSAGAPPAFPTTVEKLATVTGIDAKVVGTTNIYTIPALKELISLKAILTLTTADTISGTLKCGLGIGAGENDIFIEKQLIGFNDTTKFAVFDISTGSARKGSAGEIVKLGIDQAFTGTAATLSVDFFGYLKNA